MAQRKIEEGKPAPEFDPSSIADELAKARTEHLAERERQTLAEQGKFLEFFYVIPASVLKHYRSVTKIYSASLQRIKTKGLTPKPSMPTLNVGGHNPQISQINGDYFKRVI